MNRKFFELLQPDAWHFKLGEVECYILRKGNGYTATCGNKTSNEVSRPGDCLDWILMEYNKMSKEPPAEKLRMFDASELLEHPYESDLEAPQEREGFPHK